MTPQPQVVVMPKPKAKRKEGKPRRERGEGGLYQPFLHATPRNETWYAKVNGKRKSTGTTIKAEALEVLKKMQGRASLGIADPADLRRIKYEHGRDLVLADYKNTEAASLITKADGSVTVWGLDHLNAFFGGRSVVDINATMLQEFVDRRLKDGASPSTVNRNLALLRRMLNLLAREHDFKTPHFPHLKEPKARQGFCEPEQFVKLFAALPERLRVFTLFLYTTGCRTGEAKSLRWNQVDWKERVVRVENEQTKNDEAREIPLADEVYDRLKKTPEAKRVGLLFPVGNFRKAWQSACVRAGLGTLDKTTRSNGGYGEYDGLTPHDLRRSAVRNLRKAGIAEGVAMKVSGHRTREVFERYNIVNSDDTREAVAAVGSSLGQVLRASRARNAK